MIKSKLNVLVVDDDGIYQFTTKKTLEATGFAENIFICSNGREAIDLIQRNIKNGPGIPDVIFLDVNMPVMNGWDFLEELEHIKSSFSSLPRIYILSSTVDPEDYKRAKSFDAVVDFISKPLSKEFLEQINMSLKT